MPPPKTQTSSTYYAATSDILAANSDDAVLTMGVLLSMLVSCFFVLEHFEFLLAAAFAVAILWTRRWSLRPKACSKGRCGGSRCGGMRLASTVWRSSAPQSAAASTTGASPTAANEAGMAGPTINGLRPPLPIVQHWADGKELFKILNTEVDEFLSAGACPAPEVDQLAQRLADGVRVAIETAFPGVEVIGVANIGAAGGKSASVAVPEFDIVAFAGPHVMAKRLHGRTLPSSHATSRLDMRTLQKSAIRVCTDELVATGCFKFRRCAFRGEEPKVTLMTTPALGVADRVIPINFFVNCPTPLYDAAMVRKCNELHPHAKAFIILVRRWAKERGICQTATGSLHSYAWTLLAIHFLQVGVPACAFPPLQGFKTTTGLTVRVGGPSTSSPEVSCQRISTESLTGEEEQKDPAEEEEPPAAGELFAKFVHFYAQDSVDWRKEAICVRLGRRAPASFRSSSTQGFGATGCSGSSDAAAAFFAPDIEDPFEPRRNLGVTVTEAGAKRMMRELRHAASSLLQSASLADLLEPGSPALANASAPGR